MPIGSTYDDRGAPLPVFPGAGGAAGPGGALDGPGAGCSGCGGRSVRFWQLLTAAPTDATALGIPVAPVAELPAPPAGFEYVIERATIRNPSGALGMGVFVGDLILDNLVDGIPTTVPNFSTMADGESAIRVPPGQPLRFVFFGNPANRFTVRVQYRQEPS